MHLLEWVGVGSPPCEEEGETNSLEYAGNGTNGNGIKRTLLGKDLGDELCIISNESSNTETWIWDP